MCYTWVEVVVDRHSGRQASTPLSSCWRRKGSWARCTCCVRSIATDRPFDRHPRSLFVGPGSRGRIGRPSSAPHFWLPGADPSVVPPGPRPPPRHVGPEGHDSRNRPSAARSADQRERVDIALAHTSVARGDSSPLPNTQRSPGGSACMPTGTTSTTLPSLTLWTASRRSATRRWRSSTPAHPGLRSTKGSVKIGPARSSSPSPPLGPKCLTADPEDTTRTSRRTLRCFATGQGRWDVQHVVREARGHPMATLRGPGSVGPASKGSRLRR